jgi:hypothetical protein
LQERNAHIVAIRGFYEHPNLCVAQIAVENCPPKPKVKIMVKRRENFHCNFRAPDQEWFDIWREFKNRTKDLGLDICFVALNLCRAWLDSQREADSALTLNSIKQIVYLNQTNTFNYNVGRPRRERQQQDCSKNYNKCTLCSRAFSAYVLVTAQELDREFCFRDFSEINHDYFRKIILRLRLRGKVLAMKPRALPEFYILPEWKDRYATMAENNRVKPKVTAAENRGGSNNA